MPVGPGDDELAWIIQQHVRCALLSTDTFCANTSSSILALVLLLLLLLCSRLPRYPTVALQRDKVSARWQVGTDAPGTLNAEMLGRALTLAGRASLEAGQRPREGAVPRTPGKKSVFFLVSSSVAAATSVTFLASCFAVPTSDVANRVTFVSLLVELV